MQTDSSLSEPGEPRLRIALSCRRTHCIRTLYPHSHIALLHSSKLFIINNKYNYFPLNLQSALTTDFINHHNVLLFRLNVGYAARLNVASWSSTTVICHFISMLLSSSQFSSVVCSTVKAPPTGLGDVLQRIQSDSLGSCARKFLFTRLRVYAIKKWSRVKNEP